MIGAFSFYVGLRLWPPAVIVEWTPTELEAEPEHGTAHAADTTIDVEDVGGLYVNRGPMGYRGGAK